MKPIYVLTRKEAERIYDKVDKRISKGNQRLKQPYECFPQKSCTDDDGKKIPAHYLILNRYDECAARFSPTTRDSNALELWAKQAAKEMSITWYRLNGRTLDVQ